MVKEEKAQTELIRIMGTDIKANYTILYGLAKIKGIGIMFSNALCEVLGYDKNAKISTLSEKDLEKIENFLSNPDKKGLPSWVLNQRKDYETGKDMHLVTKDIEFNDLQLRRRIGKLKTYKALRLRQRLPVRGQRTRSNFRRNKTLAAMKSKRGGSKE